MSKHIDIVFDGPPAPERPGFIEVEDDAGKSISVGQWLQRPDGYWVLRLTTDNGDVLAFQQKFDVPMSPQPAFLDNAAETFRMHFMQEELDEFLLACNARDLAKAADALVDLVYVAHGTALMMGLPWGKLWNEVQRANMTKERAKADGSDSKRKSSLDVVKPPGWTPPDHTPVVGAGQPAPLYDTTTRVLHRENI